MRGPFTICALLIALSTTAVVAQDKDIEYGTLTVRHVDGLVTWQDRGDEASYHVYGRVAYLAPDPCAPLSLSLGIQGVRFDEKLLANTTSYTLPAVEDERLTLVKDAMFTIEALDESGNVVASDGFAQQGDPFCTVEELAAAGTGPSPSSRNTLALVSMALAAFGAIAIGGALLFRRRWRVR